MDPSYADAQRFMSPSRWVQRMPPDDAVSAHYKATLLASQQCREAIPHKLDIRYGPKAKQVLDEYGCDLPEDAPLAVYVHGGYWQDLSKQESAYPAQPLYAAGCRVFVLGYDLCPDVNLGDIIAEMSEAAKFIVGFAARHGVRRLCFWGHSVGGHLVTWIAIKGILIEAVKQAEPRKPLHIQIVPLGGIFDLRPLIHTDINDALRLSREEAEAWSPLLQTTPPQGDCHQTCTLSLLIITCEHDSPELQKQSRLMYEKMKSWMPSAELVSVDNEDHFSLVENLSQREHHFTKMLVSRISAN